MTDREWIDSIKNVSTEELFERLEFIGCDGYYGDIWNAIIEELKNRVRPQGKGGKWIISEIRCPDCLEYFQTDCYSIEELKKCPNCGADMRKGAMKNDN